MKKVLIISHNPLTTYQDMGKTLLQLVHAYPKEALCQLYIYPTIPDVDRCSSFFRVTDKDVLKSYISFFRVRGRQIDHSEINTDRHEMFENAQDEKLYRSRKNKRAGRMLLRDIMWKGAHWYNAALKQWLDVQRPELIFAAPGLGKFLYDIALKISEDRHIPIVTYLCDDYYFVDRPKQLGERLQLSLLKKKISRLMEHSAHLITICEELQTAYETHFGVPATILMTGSAFPAAERPACTDTPTAITYLGNIRCGRNLSLAQIGRTLDEINAESGTAYRLRIYTAEKDNTVLNAFDGIGSVSLCGFVGGEEFSQTLHSAQMLLHTESFLQKEIDRVKHSVSTKIADSLASGVCLFAYAPEAVASVRHLLRNNCAIVCTSPDRLKDTLLTALTDAEVRNTASENAIRTAHTWHNAEKIGNQFLEIMEKTYENSANQLRL